MYFVLEHLVYFACFAWLRWDRSYVGSCRDYIYALPTQSLPSNARACGTIDPDAIKSLSIWSTMYDLVDINNMCV